MQRVDNLRLLLGLKLKNLRADRRLGLKDLAGRTGMSVSYLSEIESGKKYPKPEKLLDLARALGVTYDELVSLQVAEPLGPFKALLQAPLLQEFPFELFGLDARQLLELMSDAPEKAGALMRALLDIGRSYDVTVEHFLLAALRSYQQMNANYFADLEAQASHFRAARGWPVTTPIGEAALAAVLRRDWAYTIDDTTLQDDADLRGFRSVYRQRRPGALGPTLYVNGRLLPAQRAFLYAREIGYQQLALRERAVSSSWLEVTSFEQVLSNFKASYFAGALLLDAGTVTNELARFFKRRSWDGNAFLALMAGFEVTPEMFFYRLTELVPQRFGLPEIYFLRFVHAAPQGEPEMPGLPHFELNKVFNLSRFPVPHGTGFDEAYCRRWLAVSAVADLTSRRPLPETPQVAAQRSRFLDASPEPAEFFEIAVARPLVLDAGVGSAVAFGMLADETFRKVVHFADDPAVPRRLVNLTCERCRLGPLECAERAAPAVRFERQATQARRRQALATLLGELSG